MLAPGSLALWSMNHIPDHLLERSLRRSLFEPGRINPERLGFAGTMFVLVGAGFLLISLYDAVTGMH